MVKFTSLLFVLFFYTLPAYSGEPDKKLHQDCIYPTIFVGRADHTGHGSGVIVRSDKISDNVFKNVFLTCGHLEDSNILDYEVVQYIYEDWSQIKETKVYPAVFSAVNHEQDLAIGVFYSENVMPIAQLDFDPKIYMGNDVFRVGCGLGDYPRLDYGKLTLFNKNGQKPFYRTSVMTVPGDSGSPLFHEYKVVGIVVSIRVYKNQLVFNISFALPLANFRTWSNNYNNDLNYAWDNTRPLPEMTFHYLNFKDYKIKAK